MLNPAQQQREIERQARELERQREAAERAGPGRAARAEAAAERERKADERARQRSIDSAIRTGGRIVTSRAGQNLLRGVFGTLFGGKGAPRPALEGRPVVVGRSSIGASSSGSGRSGLEGHLVDPALFAVRRPDEPVGPGRADQLDLVAAVEPGDLLAHDLVGDRRHPDQAIADPCAARRRSRRP